MKKFEVTITGTGYATVEAENGTQAFEKVSYMSASEIGVRGNLTGWETSDTEEYNDYKNDNTYGCDKCEKRFDWDKEIIWVTSSFGLCEKCYDNCTEKELDEIREKYE